MSSRADPLATGSVKMRVARVGSSSSAAPLAGSEAVSRAWASVGAGAAASSATASVSPARIGKRCPRRARIGTILASRQAARGADRGDSTGSGTTGHGEVTTLRLRRTWRTLTGVGEGEQPGTPEVETAPVTVTATSGRLVRAGTLVELRVHVPEGRAAFQRWYADPEIAVLLRHDQEPLSAVNSRSYFDTIILPSSAQGLCFAIHDAATGTLIGTTALTDLEGNPARRSFFRIVIGEKAFWAAGRGTEATNLMMSYAFGEVELEMVRLEVFQHNPRAIAAYRRVGFEPSGSHVEHVGPERRELHVLGMELPRGRWEAIQDEKAQTDGT